jgi:hypothetical protein
MLYTQIFISWISLFSLVSASIFCSLVHDLNALHIPDLFSTPKFFFNIPSCGPTMVPFVICLLVLCFWLWLRTLFMNFGVYPLLTDVTLKTAASCFKVSSLVHTAVALFSRHLTTLCLALCG